MQQTLLALAAILVLSIYAFSRQQESIDVERAAISSEVSLATAEVARDVMLKFEMYPYDEQAVGRTGMSRATPMAHIGPEAGETVRADFDDLDDFDGASWVEAVPRGADSLRFDVSVRVQFARTDNPDVTTTSPTSTKAVTVSVMEQILPNSGRPQAQATVRRVLTAAGQSMRNR